MKYLMFVGNAFLCCYLMNTAFNSYQINARTELAIRYNDISPLENHHCAVAFQILEKVGQPTQSMEVVHMALLQ